MDNLLPPPGERPHFAQVYMFDFCSRVTAIPSRNSSNFATRYPSIAECNSSRNQFLYSILAKFNRTNCTECTIDYSSHNAQSNGSAISRHYNQSTADEVAIIIIQPENDNESLDRDIIIQHRNTNQLRRISATFSLLHSNALSTDFST